MARMVKKEEPKVTSVREWRASRYLGYFDIGDGLEVKLANVSLMDLVEQGRVPAPLMGMVQGMVKQGGASDQISLGPDEMHGFMESINTLIRSAVLEPEMMGLDEEESAIKQVQEALAMPGDDPAEERNRAIAILSDYGKGIRYAEDLAEKNGFTEVAERWADTLHCVDIDAMVRFELFQALNGEGAKLQRFRSKSA